jgi:hypothetical protein
MPSPELSANKIYAGRFKPARALNPCGEALWQPLVDFACIDEPGVPEVGPVEALTFRATVDRAQRFTRSEMLEAHFGLVPRRFQPSERDYDGRVSECDF